MTDSDTDRPADDAASTVFHVARTPAEANLVRALLQGAGIPANVEGGMLADEFAVSQRLMNVQGVRVFVRKDHLERARAVLADARVSDAELEQQALAAAGDPGAEQPMPRHAYPDEPPSSSKLAVVLAGIFALLTVLFFGLWMEERVAGHVEDPLYLRDERDDGLLWRWRHNGAEAVRQVDRDRDLVFEEVRTYDRNGDLMMVSYDANADGLFERVIEHRQAGLRFEWLDDEGDGRFDRCRVLGPSDEVLRELRYAGPAGFLHDK